MSDFVRVTLEYTPDEARRVAHLIDKVDRSGPLAYDDHDRLLLISSAIRRALPPPKPPEPNGLGAVVKARDDVVWIRVDPVGNSTPWTCTGGGLFANGIWKRWADIDAIEVLSPGVTP